MLYWVNRKRPMVQARFEFKPEEASYFIDSEDGKRTVIELAFESVDALIATIKECEKALVDCTANIDGKIVQLRSFSCQ